MRDRSMIHPSTSARATLFGSSSTKANGGDTSGSSRGGLSRDTQELTRDADQRVTLLASQVRDMKSIAIDINSELRDHNRTLRTMDSTMDRTRAALGSTMTKLAGLTAASSNNAMCYMVCIMVTIFFIFYYFMKMR